MASITKPLIQKVDNHYINNGINCCFFLFVCITLLLIYFGAIILPWLAVSPSTKVLLDTADGVPTYDAYLVLAAAKGWSPKDPIEKFLSVIKVISNMKRH